jgi:hypothetical protein
MNVVTVCGWFPCSHLLMYTYSSVCAVPGNHLQLRTVKEAFSYAHMNMPTGDQVGRWTFQHSYLFCFLTRRTVVSTSTANDLVFSTNPPPYFSELGRMMFRLSFVLKE